MLLNLNYDSSVSAAPSGFLTAMNYVVNYFNTTFTNPVTVNINVGWGEVAGQALQSGALGESITSTTGSYTFSTIANALSSNSAKSTTDLSAVASLTSDPTNGGWFTIPTANAKVLGLSNSSGADGSVGFNSSSGIYTFDPNNRAVPGLYDFIGVATHEISEVMGRIAGLSNFGYTVLDLFRYSSAGTHQLTGGQPAYFSVNGGATDLADFNTRSGGDYGDWASTAVGDSGLAFSSKGTMNAFTTADVAAMDAIGWNTVPGGASGVSSIVASGSGITNGTGDLKAGHVVSLTVNFTAPVTVTGGTPTLSLNDGATATYASGSGSNALTFKYTVAPGDNTSDLAIANANLNGATIKDAGGLAVDLSVAHNYNPAGILKIDTAAPTLAIATTGGVVTSSAMSLSGSIDSADGGSAVSILDGTTVLGSATSSATGAWQTSINLPGYGAHNLVATATDAAGNVGNSSAVSFTLNVTSDIVKADYAAILRTADTDSHASLITTQINSGQLSYADYLNGLVTQAKDTTGAVQIINQFMAGHTLDAASLDSQVQTVTHLTQTFGNTAVGWNGLGASLADSSFAPHFAAQYQNLNGFAFILAVTSDVFGQTMYTPQLQNSLDLYINFYSQHPDVTDPTGAIRGKGYFVADMLHQASDIHWGPYPQAADSFLVGLANNTTHYGDSMLG